MRGRKDGTWCFRATPQSSEWQEISARFDRSVACPIESMQQWSSLLGFDRGIHLLAKRLNPQGSDLSAFGHGVGKSDHPSCALNSVPDAS
jgi:hypothetical protein